MTTKIRTQADRVRVSISFPKAGRTKQSFKDECDINNIMKKYQSQGLLPAMIKADPRYGDFSDALSFQEALDVVHKAQEQFQALPARVRAEFGNDPQAFLAFAENPANLEQMVQMGLATPREQPASGALEGSTPSPASPPAKKGAKGKPDAGAGSDDA